MDRNDMQAKIDALMNDEGFMQVLTEAADAQAVEALFAAEGLELFGDQAAVLFGEIRKALQQTQPDIELSDEDLENVAGGCLSAKDAAYLVGRVMKWLTGRKKDRKPARPLGPRPMDEIPRKPRH